MKKLNQIIATLMLFVFSVSCSTVGTNREIASVDNSSEVFKLIADGIRQERAELAIEKAQLATLEEAMLGAVKRGKAYEMTFENATTVAGFSVSAFLLNFVLASKKNLKVGLIISGTAVVTGLAVASAASMKFTMNQEDIQKLKSDINKINASIDSREVVLKKKVEKFEKSGWDMSVTPEMMQSLSERKAMFQLIE